MKSYKKSAFIKRQRTLFLKIKLKTSEKAFKMET